MKIAHAVLVMIPVLPWWLTQQRIRPQCGRPGFGLWVGKIPWRRAWLPTPVFLPGESPCTEKPGRLYSPHGHKELDMAERLSTYTP